MILNRYLLWEFLKVLLLCVVAFIAILMTTRLEDIARFAAFGASLGAVLRFAAYQIPYILPMATGVAALISSITLVQRLSSSQELTALRSSGLSLRQIFAPILIAAGFLAALNFYIVSEIATTSQLKSRQLKQQISLINPLTLINHSQLIQNKNLYLTSESRLLAKGTLGNVNLTLWNGATGRLNLVTAREIGYEDPLITVEGLATIASFPGSGADTLYLENVDSSKMDIQSFSSYLTQRSSKVKNDYLRLEYLLVRLGSIEDSSGYSEIFRRISLALAVVTFTLLGLAFGLRIGRRKSLMGVVIVTLLTTVQLVAFFSAKALETKPFITFFLYFGPMAAVAVISLWQIKRFSRGVE
ncbi:MAG: LptF/LptG family permease [Chlamydiia bacterium]|nr:LptF/LptG family permease [Chlamydiia bacterium]